MADKKLTNDIKDLATDAISPGLALVAAIVGGAGYPLWATMAGLASASAGSGQAVTAYLRRRASRDQERIRRLIDGSKLRHMERLTEDEDDEALDLFGEVLKNALEDDEVAKQSVYSAILDWMMEARQSAADIRIVSDAVRRLSYVELYCFVGAATRNYQHDVHGQLLTDTVPVSFDVNQMLQRLSNFGLIRVDQVWDGNLKSNGPTALGEIIVKHCNFDDLPTPAGMPTDL